ncbi:MAG: DUF971 domain-containing protein [Anaerolineae bacterium]
MNPLTHKPQNVTVDIDQRLIQINWADGHSSIYDFTYLRQECPCAACQPWKEGQGPVGVKSASARNAIGELRRIEDVSMVGAYALHFQWTDGHDSGIYSFEYLRNLCPCEEHAAIHRQEERTL